MREVGETVESVLEWRVSARPGQHWPNPHPIAQDTLDRACAIVNVVFAAEDSPLRVYNSMGDILPTLAAQRSLL